MSVPADRMSGVGQNRDMAMDPTAQVIQLASSGIPIDQITAMTGLPTSIIQGIVSSNQTTNRVGDTVGGIPSTGTQNSITEMAGGVTTTETDNMEKGVAETLTKLGFDNIADVDSDENQPLYKKNAVATLAGINDTENANTSRETVDSVEQINELGNSGPEGELAANKIYIDGLSEYLGTSTEELKKMVPKPDQALPFLVAGAALINSGTNGEDWGTALSNAYLQYAVGSSKEKKAYRNAIASMDIDKVKSTQKFASALYLEDIKNQKALAQKLLTSDVQLYKVSQDGVMQTTPMPLTDPELIHLRSNPQFGTRIEGKWTESDGTMKNYTIYPKDGGPPHLEMMTEASAVAASNSGDYENIVVGDQLGEAKFFSVNGVDQLMTPEEALQSQKDGDSVKKVLNPVPVLDNSTNPPTKTWVSPDIIKEQAKAGTSRYTRDSEVVGYAIDAQGNPVFGDPSTISLVLDRGTQQKVIKEFGDQYKQSNFNRNRILNTIDSLRDISQFGREQGAPRFFGLTGEGVKLGRKFKTQINQLGDVFTKGNNFNFYQSNTESGEITRDSKKMNFNEFKNMFAMDKYVKDTAFGSFLLQSGMNSVEAENLIFRLALTSAMLEGQKGRDISDKDIERFLNMAGGKAQNEQEFFTIIDNLEYNAIDYVDKLVYTGVELDPAQMIDPNDPEKTVRTLEYTYRGIIDADNDYLPSPNRESIQERRDRLQVRRQTSYNRDASGSRVQIVTPEGGEKKSGIGISTIDEIYLDILNSPNPMNRLEFYRAKNPEAYNKTINPYLLKRLEDDPKLIEAIPQLGGTP